LVLPIVLLVCVLGAISPVTAQSQALPVALPVHGSYLAHGNLSGTFSSGGSNQLFLVDTFTGSWEVIDENERLITSPIWDPQGERIAYIDGPTDITILRPSDGTRQTIEDTGRNATFYPQSWSSDETNILYVTPNGGLPITHYTLDIFDVTSQSLTTVLTYQIDQPLTGIPLPPRFAGISPPPFRGIRQADWNPVYPEWIALQLDSQTPEMLSDSGYPLVVEFSILYDIQSGQILSLDQLLSNQEHIVVSYPIQWSSDGKRLIMRTTRPSQARIIGFENDNGNWMLELLASAETEHYIGNWLGVGDLLLSLENDPVTKDDVYYISQIIDGSWHSTEFFRLPSSIFDHTNPGDWHITASEDEKRVLTCLFDQALPTQLAIGTLARVNFTTGAPLRLRTEPNVEAAEIQQMLEGTEFNIISGPACDNADSYYRFWEVQLGDATTGWAAEANNSEYFMEPVLPTPTPTPTPTVTCTLTVGVGDTAGLIAVLNTANGSGAPSTICLTQSVYTLMTGDNTTDGANGLPSITGDITLVGNGATIQRDPAAPAFRLFHIAANGSLTLDTLTVNGGLASGTAPGDDGGAVYNRGTLALVNSIVSGNSASTDGGGIYNWGTLTLSQGSNIANNSAGDDGGGIYNEGGTLTVTDSTIADNTTSDQGGGIRSVGTNMTLTNANLTGNSALNASGGGLYATSTTLTMNGGQISGNSANAGGGLYLTNSPSAAQLDGVQIVNNSGVSGGGIYLSQDGDAVLTNVTVSGNQASSSAAGIWAGAALTLTSSTVSNNGNSAQPGSAGGIRAAGGTLTVSDSVISGNLVNSGSGQGAGVYIASAGAAAISGGEISGNSAYNGGGLYNTGSLSLGTTVSGNTAANHGGGMYVSSGTAGVNGSTFSGNTATNRGGAITSNATLQVDASLFATNTANNRGGAIYIGSGTGSWVHSSCIAGNTSPNASGIYSAPAGFDAADNWWGAANGPSGAGSGSGDGVNNTVTFNPFITTECPSNAGAGGGSGLMSLQTMASARTTIPALAPARLPVSAAFEAEGGWYADGAWMLDTLLGHTSAPSWAVNTVPRDQESILEMSAPVDLRRARSARLRFWQRGQIASNDQVLVEVLPEGANDWVVVDSQTSLAGEWSQRTVDLSAYSRQTVRLRIRVVAGGELETGETSRGVWLDDLTIENR
jgi:predicted outer membrane repeat protein